MASSIFYKFKNSREPERIVFSGTNLNVFELKREIIAASGLGDGTDFNLHMYPEDDLATEYKDDTVLIPRSATVVCIRRPAPRGQGRAARYVSGKAPVRAITKDASKTAAPLPLVGGAAAEEDAEAAFLRESAQVWDAQKATLSLAKPVYNNNNNNNNKKKPVNVPTHDPPPGYVCRRCNIKGHWIQACPTNDDPDYKPVFQAKRTTGIPRSFLKTVEKPIDEEAAKGVMLNADGEYVQVMTDTRTWEKFQEKTNASKARAASVDAESKELREQGLECPLDKQRFVDPVKTPCCGKTYCRECIDNALADGDLVCPNCGQQEVLMDDLQADEDMVSSLRKYDAEKAKVKEEKAKAEAEAEALVQPPVTNEKSTSDSETSMTSKKRKSPPTDIKPPTAPKAMRETNNSNPELEQFKQQMEALKNGQPPMPMMGMGMPMPFPMGQQMGFQQPNMGFNNNMPMGGGPMGFPNPMMHQPGFMQQQQPQQYYGPPQGMQPQNDAYERQPVNNRGQRNRRARAPDFRYV
jgi:protein MPE1